MYFDDRNSLKGKAAIHALIVGISAYPNLATPDAADAQETKYNLGLRQLRSAALGAFEIAQWLVRNRANLNVPLASVRLMLTPSASETAASSDLAAATADPAAQLPNPTLINLSKEANAWRADANANPQGITFLYFAGHGMQRENGDRVLLLHDFGQDGPLQLVTTSCTHLLNGMWPSKSFPKLALRQAAFFDACQYQPEVLDDVRRFEPGEVWNFIEKARGDQRTRLVIYSTMPGALAYGNPGQKSFFCEALLKCLNGGAGEQGPVRTAAGPQWRVTASSLVNALQPHLDDINQREGRTQISECQQVMSDFEICKLNSPPQADVSLYVDPSAAMKCVTLTVHSETNQQVIGPPHQSNPLRKTMPCGIYILRAQAKGRFVGEHQRLIPVKPPVFKESYPFTRDDPPPSAQPPAPPDAPG